MILKTTITMVILLFTVSAGSAEVDAKLLGRISRGMVKIQRGAWYDCGDKLTIEEQHSKAVRIAYNVLKNEPSFSPWGVIGTMYNESRFDSCALGYYPRKWAYKNGLLMRRKTTISHSFEDILNVVTDKEADNEYSMTGFDLGLCQILSRFYPNQEREMLSIARGVGICVGEMENRAARNKTKTPWLYWRGHAAEWYRTKIKRWVKRMGATAEELREL